MAARYSTAAVTMGHNALTRAIRHAESRDLVARNVATLVETPKGQAGRPSKSLTLAQAAALLRASSEDHPPLELHPGLADHRRPVSLMHAYIVLSLTTGLRTEEMRALRWDHVDLKGNPGTEPPTPPHVSVWRSVRGHGDTKTEKSRRTLELPEMAVAALQDQLEQQEKERRAAGAAVARQRSRVHHRHRRCSRRRERPEDVPGDLPVGPDRRALDAEGAKAQFRIAHVRAGNGHRGDRPPSGP